MEHVLRVVCRASILADNMHVKVTDIPCLRTGAPWSVCCCGDSV